MGKSFLFSRPLYFAGTTHSAPVNDSTADDADTTDPKGLPIPGDLRLNLPSGNESIRDWPVAVSTELYYLRSARRLSDKPRGSRRAKYGRHHLNAEVENEIDHAINRICQIYQLRGWGLQ